MRLDQEAAFLSMSFRCVVQLDRGEGVLCNLIVVRVMHDT